MICQSLMLFSRPVIGNNSSRSAGLDQSRYTLTDPASRVTVSETSGLALLPARVGYCARNASISSTAAIPASRYGSPDTIPVTSLASIHRPIPVGRFRLRFLHEEFSGVNPGAGVLPLAWPAACPGFLARGRGSVAVGAVAGADRSGLVRPLRRAGRRRRRTGSAIRARGASPRAGAG